MSHAFDALRNTYFLVLGIVLFLGGPILFAFWTSARWTAELGNGLLASFWALQFALGILVSFITRTNVMYRPKPVAIGYQLTVVVLPVVLAVNGTALLIVSHEIRAAEWWPSLWLNLGTALILAGLLDLVLVANRAMAGERETG